MLRAQRLLRILALLLPFLGAMCLVLLQVESLLPLANTTILINEADAETPGTDSAEFVELYDGGGGHTSLDGLVVVFFNGQDDRSYRTFDLAGHQTNGDGFFLLANEAFAADLTFPDNVLQNGPDAIALYSGQGSDFPNGTAVTTTNLQDALVYDTADPDDSGLLILLQGGEPQVDENGRDLAEFHSNQRCPDGGGGGRQTATYIQNLPTPKSANNCPIIDDEAPAVTTTSPTPGAANVAPDEDITITFSEPVLVNGNWYTIDCTHSGAHSAAVSAAGLSFTLDPVIDFTYGESCSVNLLAVLIVDVDTQDPPDEMVEDYSWSFTIEDPLVASDILINEIDVDTVGSDTLEFIELYDGGAGSTSLTGLVVVLFNGSADTSYRAIDLDGQHTDAQGFFVIGNASVSSVDLVIPSGAIQNGADAAAIYQGSAGGFPSGTPLSTTNLLDAIVYDTDDEDDPGLLALLNPGQPQVNEASRGVAALDSNQRCSNGSGGQRNTDAFLQNQPTPGVNNKCSFDSPPRVRTTSPFDGQENIELNSSLSITFDEEVQVADDAIELICIATGSHGVTINGGPTQFAGVPDTPFTSGDKCTAKVIAVKISDLDNDDPPDHMVNDYSWSFSLKTEPVATHILINEVDADTPGADTAEFIELFDGGSGNTKLDGLVLVLFNGYADTSYRTIDLDGQHTDELGYFVLGGGDAAGIDLLLPDSTIQNGADAVALYAAGSADFPNGSAVTLDGLLDALVYDTDDEDDAGLLILLKNGEPQVNEASRESEEFDSSQRCPNGAGAQRESGSYLQNPATPGKTNDCTLDTPPEVAETFPSQGQNDVDPDSNLTIHFTEDVEVQDTWFAINCSQSLDHTAAQSGGPRFFTLDPQVDFNGGELCLVTLTAEQIVDLDGLPQPMTADYSWSFNTGAPQFGDCGDPATPISLIQGSQLSSPLTGTQAVIIEGVVVGDFQGQDGLEGFFLQEESPEHDGDPQTSEGIFVHDADWGVNVDTGEIVRVQGTVIEKDGLTSLTDLAALHSCGLGPTPNPLDMVLPVPTLHTWEQVEGMLIHLTHDLMVTGSARLGSEGVVDLAHRDRLWMPTEMTTPGETALAIADLNHLSHIMLDDGRNQPPSQPTPPYLGPDNTLRIGDIPHEVQGILAGTTGGYRIHPTEPVVFARQNARPAPSAAAEGALRAAVFDTGGYFNGDGQGSGFPGAHGASTLEEFARQRTKLINAILGMDADVVSLLSLENDGFGPYSALQDLVDGLNQAAPAEPYSLIDPAVSHMGEGDLAIGLIYRSGELLPLGTVVTTDTIHFDGPNVQPLIQTFATANDGAKFVLAAAHFHDRAPCPPAGDPNSDQNDGQGCWNPQRVLEARSLTELLLADAADSVDADILIMGNLNAYTHENPLAELGSAGYINLADHYFDGGYTTVSNAETGTILHAFVSPNMSPQITAANQWHINADEPSILDYRQGNPPALYAPDVYRSSEQDPIWIDMRLLPNPQPAVKIFLPLWLAAPPQ